MRPDGGATEETVYKAVTQLGEIFNVPDVARQLNADIRNDFKVAEEALASSGHSGLKAVWLDCMPNIDGTGGCCDDNRPGWDPSKTIFVGGGHGGPNIIMQESGLVNAFANKPDSWYCVSMEEIIAADPDVFVIVDANWDNATKKLDYLHNHTDFCGMRAVKRADYIKIQFSASNLGPRNGVAALDMVNAAIHVTTGADTLNFNSGVDFFEKKYLVDYTAGMQCPLDPEKVKSSKTTYTNCGVTTTLAKAPERVVALHQGSIELMLALGLEDKMVGTASMDDVIWPRYKAAYDKIPTLSPGGHSGLPNETTIMAVQPDFIIGAYSSAFAEFRSDNKSSANWRISDSKAGIFSDATVGPCDGENSEYFTDASTQALYPTCRPQLNANGIGTWLWVDCTPRSNVQASTHTYTAPSLHTHGPCACWPA